MNADILDQAAIDALLNGGMPEEPPDDDATDDPSVPREYDFSTQTRIVRGRMPTLEMISERLARSLRLSVYSMLGRSPEISVLGVTTPRYADYIPGLTVPTSLNRIRFQPLSGAGLMVFEANLVFAIIDAFFGGNGRHAKIEGREFTPTESQIIHMLLELVTRGLEEAWAPVLPARIEFINSEMNPGFVNLASPTEVVVVTRLHVEIDGKGGEIHVTLPWAMLGPIKDTLRAGMQSDQADREERWSQVLRNQLEDAPVDLVARIGTACLSLRTLMSMRPGDIIPCDLGDSTDVLSDGVSLFRGELQERRGRQVIRIDEMTLRKTRNTLDAFAERK